MRKPAEFMVDDFRFPVEECQTFSLDDEFGGSSEQVRRGTRWWKTRVWRTRQDCEVSLAVYVYQSAESADENFDFRPEVVYGDSWPWDPHDVPPPQRVRANKAEVTCLGGSPEAACKDWYYWARYEKVLVQLQFYNVETEGIKVSEGQFMRLVNQLDDELSLKMREK